MTLTFPFHRPFISFKLDPWLPTFVAWMLLAFLISGIGWSYFSNPRPGPYGMCSANHGRSMISCETAKNPGRFIPGSPNQAPFKPISP
jgi:hypothetical protein